MRVQLVKIQFFRVQLCLALLLAHYPPWHLELRRAVFGADWKCIESGRWIWGDENAAEKFSFLGICCEVGGFWGKKGDFVFFSGEKTQSR